MVGTLWGVQYTFSIHENANLEIKWLSKVGCHGNVSVDVHVMKTLNCSQIN